jgi:hypothetical protein
MKRGICRTVVFVVLIGVGCAQPPPGKGQGEIAAAQGSSGGAVRFRVETVASGLEVPWAMAFPPDGRIFVTERPGRVRVIEAGRLRPAPLATIPDVEPAGESGLMDLSLHPRFADNRLLYLAYAYQGDGQRVRIVRFREHGGTLTERTVIIEDIPAARFHAGTRVRFGPDGKLYITTGDATARALAQQLDSLAGKTLRLNDDGTVPADNPFVISRAPGPKSGPTSIVTRRGLRGSRARICSFRPSTVPRCSMALAAAMRSTSSSPGRTTGGPSFITRKRAPAWRRHCWNTPRRSLPPAPCSIAALRFRSFVATSSSETCAANASSASCWTAGVCCGKSAYSSSNTGAFATSPKIPPATSISPPRTATGAAARHVTTTVFFDSSPYPETVTYTLALCTGVYGCSSSARLITNGCTRLSFALMPILCSPAA